MQSDYVVVPALSTWFYVLYAIAGLSDMLGGFVARITKTASDFGSLLDSIADVIFLVIALFKILPCLEIQFWVWIWISAIAILKAFNFICGLLLKKRIVMPHTIANKITGLYLFLAPILMLCVDLSALCILLCTVASFAAVEESYFIIKSKTKYIKLY